MDFGDYISGYNYSLNGNEADHAALWADWELIGKDLLAAAKVYSRSLRDNVQAKPAK